MRTSRTITRIIAVAACVTAAVAMPRSAGAATSPVLPVSYSIIAAGIATLADPTASPPGANDWSCKPTAAHPEPVVLVHGLGANMADNWNTMSPLLKNNGYCVFALTYGLDPGEDVIGGVEPMEQSSHQLAAFIARVLAATGASKVDLVGHSEGTVMPQYYLKELGGAAYVDKYVALAPLYHGTALYGAASALNVLYASAPAVATALTNVVGTECGSCASFLTGSPFLTHLYADGIYAVPGVTYTTIMTKYDELVQPYTSGYIDAPNVTNIVVQNQCPIDFAEHGALAFDPVAGQDILNALDPAHPRRVPCTLVLPLIGAPQAGTPGTS
jgi:triacylglycerol lipase